MTECTNLDAMSQEHLALHELSRYCASIMTTVLDMRAPSQLLELTDELNLVATAIAVLHGRTVAKHRQFEGNS